jgi:transposase
VEVVKNMPMYVGLDVHKGTCHATVIDESGKIVKEARFRNLRTEFEYFFKGIGDAKVAMEASYCYQPVYELLEWLGYEVKLSHPKKTRAIAETKIKTDAKDSEVLAQLLMLDWLPTSYVPPMEIRELRDLVRLRTYLVMVRTMFKNKIRAELAKRWIEASDPFTKRGKQLLRNLGIFGVNQCLPVLEVLDERIAELSKLVKQKAGESEGAKLLMTIPGVGYFSALAILAEIGDINRFPSEEKLCAYAGLVPSLDQSGNMRRLGHITREGSRLLRWILVECVWVHLRYDTRVTRFFRKVARRRGEQVAAVATARKLLVAIYWMLKRREKFRP